MEHKSKSKPEKILIFSNSILFALFFAQLISHISDGYLFVFAVARALGFIAIPGILGIVVLINRKFHRGFFIDLYAFSTIIFMCILLFGKLEEGYQSSR